VATFAGLGAIANVIQAIYNARSFFIEQASQIQALVNAVKDSIGNIAAGQVGAATNYIESALARSLSVAINFLARQVGLGNVGQKVREIIQRVRVRVDAAVNKLIEYVAQQGNSWLAKAGRGRSNNQQPIPNNRPKPQPTTQNRPGQNNRQPAGNQHPKPQPAKPSPVPPNNKTVPNNRSERQQKEQAKLVHDRKVRAGLNPIDLEETKYLENAKIYRENARKVAAKVKQDYPIFKVINVINVCKIGTTNDSY